MPTECARNAMAIALACGLTFMSTNLFAQQATPTLVPVGPQRRSSPRTTYSPKAALPLAHSLPANKGGVQTA